MRRVISTLVAIAAVAALLSIVAISRAGAQDQPAPTARFATGVVTVGPGGFTNVLFVKHGGACRTVNVDLNTGFVGATDCRLPLPAGHVRPDTVIVEGVSPIGGPVGTRPFQHVADSFTDHGFRLRLADFNGAVTAGSQVVITYRATSDPNGYCDANICS
jgi:hypothetical protein